MKKLLVILAFIAGALSAIAAPKPSAKANGGYNIQLEMKDLKDTTVYLAFYYNGKTFSKDTARIDHNGVAVFKGEKPLQEGVYIVYFKTDKFFDVLIGKDQNVKIKADTVNLEPNVTAGDESIKFCKLVQFMTSKNKQRRDLSEKLKAGKIDTASYNTKVDAITAEVEKFQQQQITENKGKFFAEFVQGTIPVEIPEFKELPDTARPMARYQFAKNHYFDNINLSSARMLYTPYLSNKIDSYLQRYLIQNPDSICQAAEVLIEKSKGDTATYQTMLSKMMNYALKSNQMGMDKMWYTIAEKYYLSGEAYWADSTWIEDLKAECKKVRYNMIGMQAKNLRMRDRDSMSIELKDVVRNKKPEFTLVYFFEPTCGHCKKITPVLHDSVYVKYKDKGFEVFCCYTQLDKKEWQEFLDKHKLHDWVNVWDPDRRSYFWEYYDATVTPGVYLINKEGKIVAKKISTDSLDQILEEELIVKKLPAEERDGYRAKHKK